MDFMECNNFRNEEGMRVVCVSPIRAPPRVVDSNNSLTPRCESKELTSKS